MNCEYIVKNNFCKFKFKYTYLSKKYCTRHYNILIKKSTESDDNINTESTNNNNNNNINNNDINNYAETINDNIEIIDNNIIDILINNNIINNNITQLYKNDNYTEYKITINDDIILFKYQDLTNNNKNILYYDFLLLSNDLTNRKYVLSCNENVIKYYNCEKNKYAYIIYENIYKTLNEYIQDLNNELSLLDIINIGIQLIKIIEYIHSKKYIYLNLNLDNIIFTNKVNIKIKNFENCIKYINTNSEFYPNELINKKNNNIKFNSRNINNGNRGQRYDDIESILYIILYLLNDKIIQTKEIIFTEYKSNYKFINDIINEINENLLIEHKKPNYKKLIDILKNYMKQ